MANDSPHETAPPVTRGRAASVTSALEAEPAPITHPFGASSRLLRKRSSSQGLQQRFGPNAAVGSFVHHPGAGRDYNYSVQGGDMDEVTFILNKE